MYTSGECTHVGSLGGKSIMGMRISKLLPGCGVQEWRISACSPHGKWWDTRHNMSNIIPNITGEFTKLGTCIYNVSLNRLGVCLTLPIVITNHPCSRSCYVYVRSKRCHLAHGMDWPMSIECSVSMTYIISMELHNDISNCSCHVITLGCCSIASIHGCFSIWWTKF